MIFSLMKGIAATTAMLQEHKPSTKWHLREHVLHKKVPPLFLLDSFEVLHFKLYEQSFHLVLHVFTVSVIALFLGHAVLSQLHTVDAIKLSQYFNKKQRLPKCRTYYAPWKRPSFILVRIFPVHQDFATHLDLQIHSLSLIEESWSYVHWVMACVRVNCLCDK